MRSYLILVENRNQMKFIVDKFNTMNYNIRKDACCDDYYVIKQDDTVKYYVKTQNEVFRGYKFNGYIYYEVNWNKELDNKIRPCLIERYYEKDNSVNYIPTIELRCWDERAFNNAIRLIENYDKVDRHNTPHEEKLAIVIKQLRTDRDRLLDAFDKIRDEIEELELTYYCLEVRPRSVIDDVLEIIDKYRAER